MGTLFSEISDLALITMQDYKLDQLYEKSEEDFATFMAGFIVRSIPLFAHCKQSLDYDLEEQAFINVLTNKEKDILANYVIQLWVERIQHNLTRLSATMTPSDAKRTNLPQQIEKTQSVINEMREKNNQNETVYELQTFDFRKAANGDFF